MCKFDTDFVVEKVYMLREWTKNVSPFRTVFSYSRSSTVCVLDSELQTPIFVQHCDLENRKSLSNFCHFGIFPSYTLHYGISFYTVLNEHILCGWYVVQCTVYTLDRYYLPCSTTFVRRSHRMCVLYIHWMYI